MAELQRLVMRKIKVVYKERVYKRVLRNLKMSLRILQVIHSLPDIRQYPTDIWISNYLRLARRLQVTKCADLRLVRPCVEQAVIDPAA